jgi:hypothetical protein
MPDLSGRPVRQDRGDVLGTVAGAVLPSVLEADVAGAGGAGGPGRGGETITKRNGSRERA